MMDVCVFDSVNTRFLFVLDFEATDVAAEAFSLWRNKHCGTNFDRNTADYWLQNWRNFDFASDFFQA